jgi:hypothetical protein
VLQLCQRAGLVTLGPVALDGKKVKANASKHKAMSYARMGKAEETLAQEVASLLEQARQVDAAEDAQHGRGRRGDELPAELARRESRLQRIREAKAAWEAEAKGGAVQAAEAARATLAERERRAAATGRNPRGRPPRVPDPAKAQRNFTDPDSRIMKDGDTQGFERAHNARAAVDGTAQIIVAAGVTQEANDRPRGRRSTSGARGSSSRSSGRSRKGAAFGASRSAGWRKSRRSGS